MAKKKSSVGLPYFIKNINTILGIIFIWRGVWHLLNDVDIYLGNAAWTTLGGIIIGFLMLYLPDHDLKEIEKM